MNHNGRNLLNYIFSHSITILLLFVIIISFLFCFIVLPGILAKSGAANPIVLQFQFGLIYFISLAALLLMFIFVLQRIKKDIKKFTTTLNNLTRIDSYEIIERSGERDIRPIAEALVLLLQTMIKRLSEMYNEAVSIGRNADEMHIKSSDAENESGEHSRLAEEIIEIVSGLAQTINQMARLSTDQSEDLNNLGNLIKSFSETSVFIGSSINYIVEQSKDLSEKSSYGKVTLTKIADEILSTVRDTQEITSVLDVINDISDRINLLSLNAAIEAARAGESGRGFAVVADEISKLAEQTAISVSGISKMIDEKNRFLENSSGKINSAITAVEEVMTGVQDLSSGLKKIEKTVSDQAKMNEYVVSEAGKISNKSEEIENTSLEQKMNIYDTINYTNTLSKHSKSINEVLKMISVFSENIKAASEKFRRITRGDIYNQ